MNECVRRWKENQPLTAAELNGMRFQAGLRTVLMLVLLAFVVMALCGCHSANAFTFQMGEAQGKFPDAKVVEDFEEFDGVTIVVAVKSLTGYAPELRKRAALEADRVLRELADAKLNGKVRTRLITEVAEPYSFRNFEAASMLSAQPVLVHVLVPSFNRKLTVGMILKKVQELAHAHFLEDLQKYQCIVTFQRLNPEKYQVGIMAATLAEPTLEDSDLPLADPSAPTPIGDGPEKKSRDHLILTMITAWLAERSKLAAKLVGIYRKWTGNLS